MTIKTKYIVYGILLSLIGVLIGSVNHLSTTFASLENEGEGFVSWVLAIAIEAGMLSLSFGVAERRRQNKSARDLIAYLVAFGVINLFCNTNYSLSVIVHNPSFKWINIARSTKIDWWVFMRVGFTSCVLPLLILALTEQYSVFLLKLKREQAEEERLASMTDDEIAESKKSKRNKKSKVAVDINKEIEKKKPTELVIAETSVSKKKDKQYSKKETNPPLLNDVIDKFSPAEKSAIVADAQLKNLVRKRRTNVPDVLQENDVLGDEKELATIPLR